ncbi:hypothetical protein [Streptomyces sp. NPDC048172]|uniref:hypothetical protein n=1 Tax=Streptomyces sp. NPDC048172 TaxID=3365505 RepID=UPI003712EDFD
MSVPPTWSQLLDLLNRPKPALRGTYQIVRPRLDDGHGWPPPSTAQETTRFAFRPPAAWRFEADDDVSFTPDAAPHPGLSFGSGPFPWAFDASPERLVPGAVSDTLAAAEALSAAEPVTHDGRPAWAIRLTTRPVTDLRLTVDSELGLILRAESPSRHYGEQLTGLHSHVRLTDADFEWSEELEAAEQRRLARWEEASEHYRHHSLPLPLYWPGPLEDTLVWDGDLATGFLILALDSAEPPDVPQRAYLIRQPPSDPSYEQGPLTDPTVFVHRWRDSTWHWTLAVEDRPLTPDELRRVKDSLPGS